LSLRLSISIILLFTFFIDLKAQEQTPLEISLWEINIQKTLKYPSSALTSGLEGTVVVELKLTSEGAIDSILIVHDSRKPFKDAVLESLEKSMELWTPDLLAKSPEAERFLITFGFNKVKPTASNPLVTAQKLMSEKKYEKAIKVLNNAIDDKPYNSKLYDLRAKVYLVSGNQEKFVENMQKAEGLKKNVLFAFAIYTYTTTTVRRVSGSF
jgi:tetratricopeptide (TPR) repeat protein